MVTSRNKVLLTMQDVDILVGHIPAYRLTTSAALTSLFFRSPKATKKWVRRMREADLIRSAHLGVRSKYHQLTEKSVRLFRLPDGERLTKSLGAGARQRAFGVLAFTKLGSKRYQSFTYAEFVRRFPALDLNGPIDAYYRDTDGPPQAPKRIGYILVDCGRDVGRVTQRLHELIMQRLNHDAWRQVLENSRFVLTIVTTAEAKRSQLEDAIRQRRDERYLLRSVPIRVEVREALRDLAIEQEQQNNESEPPTPNRARTDSDG